MPTVYNFVNFLLRFQRTNDPHSDNSILSVRRILFWVFTGYEDLFPCLPATLANFGEEIRLGVRCSCLLFTRISDLARPYCSQSIGYPSTPFYNHIDALKDRLVNIWNFDKALLSFCQRIIWEGIDCNRVRDVFRWSSFKDVWQRFCEGYRIEVEWGHTWMVGLCGEWTWVWLFSREPGIKIWITFPSCFLLMWA